MALKNIEYGSIASSQLLNDNFQYLDEKIGTYDTRLDTINGNLTSQITSQVSTLRNNLNSEVASITEKQTELEESVNTSLAKTLVAVLTQDNIGTLKLTDPVSNKSIIIQYGNVTGMGNGTTKTVTLPIAYSSDTSYSVVTSATYKQTAGDKGSAHYTNSHKTNSFVIGSCFEQSGGHTIWWIAIGH